MRGSDQKNIDLNNMDRTSVDLGRIRLRSVGWKNSNLIDVDENKRFDSNCLNNVVSKEGSADGVDHWKKRVHWNGVGSRANDSGGRSSVRLH